MKLDTKKLVGWSVLILLLSVTLIQSAFAHSGGTNSEGCHTKKSTGEYHCHNKK